MASSIPKGYNPGPTLDQKQQLQSYLDENEAKGAPVHSFNPDASPQEKAAIAGKAQSQLQSIIQQQQQHTVATSLPVAAAGTVAPAVPTVTIEDVDEKLEQQKQRVQPPKSDQSDTQSAHSTVTDGADGVPGKLPAAPAPAIPDWYKIGWKAVGGLDTPESEEPNKQILAAFIADQYFGDWYHNAAIVVVAIVVTHFLTLFRFGWGWIIILMAFCATYYSTSIQRVRRRARDDIQRELAKTRLADEAETADWMNTFLERFWLIYEPVLSRSIVASVEQILSVSTPAFLDSLRLSTFSLGTKAPHIDEVRTHTNTAEDVVLMEWGISFTPNDVSDITPREAQKKINPKIVLEIRLGKGLTAAMPVLLEDITFQGKMKIRLKLMTAFPHIQMVDLSFMEKPHIDFVLKPIGGETFGFDIASIPGLSSFIHDMVHATLGPMMYDPNVFTLNLEQLMSGVPLDTSIGVLQVTIVSAQGLKGNKFGGGDLDPYVAICVNNETALENTRWKQNTRNPHWQETKFILLSSLNGMLNLKVVDYNMIRQHDDLGLVTWDLAGLAEDATQEGILKQVMQNGKPRGELKFDLAFYPVLKAEGDHQPETTVGVVRLVVHQAKELDPGGGLSPFSKDVNPYCKVYLAADEWIHSTPLVKHSLSPVWESAKEFLCADRDACTLTVKVIDDRDFRKDPVIGHLTIRLNDLLKAKKPAPGESVRDWWPLSGCKSGRIRMSAEWKPLDMAGSLFGAAKYQPPIGIVRMHIKKAVDVKNVEGGLGGKSDPYVRVLVQNATKARTEVINNSLNPVWDQYVYIPVHSLKENMFLECMDYQHLTKDRSLGVVELTVADLAVPAQESGDPKYPYRSLGVKEYVSKIRLEVDSYKGELHYTAEFIPAVHLKGVSFGKPKNQVQEALDADRGGEVNNALDSDSDYQKVPQDVTVTLPRGRKDPGKVPVATSTTTTANGSGRGGSLTSAKTGDEEGVEISKEELLKSTSGVIVFDIISGRLAKKACLEILMDDGYWPVFGTPKSRSTDARWDMVGEGFIKELDFGHVWLRLNESDDGEKEDVVAEYKGNAKEFLERALNTPTEFELYDTNGASHSVVTIAAKFVPVPIVLSPRESINNQGSLRVDILDGKDIPAVDRAGTSDPYVQVILNGEKVYKTEVKKKSLAPVWNEYFVATLYSRVAADFTIEVYDWDQIGSNDLLGTAKVDLAELEPLVAMEKMVHLHHAKLGNKASIRLRFLFTPEMIAKSRRPTSTFSTAGRAMTQIGAAPVGVGKGVVSGVGAGVGAVGKGVIGMFKKEGSKAVIEDHVVHGAPPLVSVPQPIPVSAVPTGQNGASSSATTFPQRSTSPPIPNVSSMTLPGTLRVEVMHGHDLMAPDGDQVKPYVVASIGEAEQRTRYASKTNTPIWNEVLTFNGVGPETQILHIGVFDHKTIGKDKPLGDADVEIWKNLQPNAQSPSISSVVKVDLRQGFGKITLRLDFEMNMGRAASISSGDHGFGGSKSRFTMRNLSRSNLE